MRLQKRTIAPAGSTGNNTHAGVSCDSSGKAVAVLFTVEVAGATPTVTWKAQGSLDSTDGISGAWFDLLYITDASDTAAATALVQTTVANPKVVFLDKAADRNYNWIRVVTSANTNVTYRAEMFEEGME